MLQNTDQSFSPYEALDETLDSLVNIVESPEYKSHVASLTAEMIPEIHPSEIDGSVERAIDVIAEAISSDKYKAELVKIATEITSEDEAVDRLCDILITHILDK